MPTRPIGTVEQRSFAAITRGAADGLCLAAAPTFAVMALVAGSLDGGTAAMLCPAMHDAWSPNGMVWMYVLMSAFHSAPWLRLMSRRRSAAESRHTCHSRHALSGTYLSHDHEPRSEER